MDPIQPSITWTEFLAENPRLAAHPHYARRAYYSHYIAPETPPGTDHEALFAQAQQAMDEYDRERGAPRLERERRHTRPPEWSTINRLPGYDRSNNEMKWAYFETFIMPYLPPQTDVGAYYLEHVHPRIEEVDEQTSARWTLRQTKPSDTEDFWQWYGQMKEAGHPDDPHSEDAVYNYDALYAEGYTPDKGPIPDEFMRNPRKSAFTMKGGKLVHSETGEVYDIADTGPYDILSQLPVDDMADQVVQEARRHVAPPGELPPVDVTYAKTSLRPMEAFVPEEHTPERREQYRQEARQLRRQTFGKVVDDSITRTLRGLGSSASQAKSILESPAGQALREAVTEESLKRGAALAEAGDQTWGRAFQDFYTMAASGQLELLSNFQWMQYALTGSNESLEEARTSDKEVERFLEDRPPVLDRDWVSDAIMQVGQMAPMILESKALGKAAEVLGSAAAAPFLGPGALAVGRGLGIGAQVSFWWANGAGLIMRSLTDAGVKKDRARLISIALGAAWGATEYAQTVLFSAPLSRTFMARAFIKGVPNAVKKIIAKGGPLGKALEGTAAFSGNVTLEQLEEGFQQVFEDWALEIGVEDPDFDINKMKRFWDAYRESFGPLLMTMITFGLGKTGAVRLARGFHKGARAGKDQVRQERQTQEDQELAQGTAAGVREAREGDIVEHPDFGIGEVLHERAGGQLLAVDFGPEHGFKRKISRDRLTTTDKHHNVQYWRERMEKRANAVSQQEERPEDQAAQGQERPEEREVGQPPLSYATSSQTEDRETGEVSRWGAAVRDTMKEWWRRTYFNLADQHHGYELLMRRYAQQKGIPRDEIPLTRDPQKLARMYLGFLGAVESYLGEEARFGQGKGKWSGGQFNIDDVSKAIGEPLGAILQPLMDAGELDPFFDAAKALHAREIKRRYEKLDKEYTLPEEMTEEWVEEQIIRWENKPLWQTQLKKLVDFQNTVLDQLVKGEVLTAEGAQEMKELYPWHVPFYRVFAEDVSRKQKRAARPRRLKSGGEQEIQDLANSIILNTTMYLRSALDNQTKITAVRAMQEMGSEEIEKVRSFEFKPGSVRFKEMVGKIADRIEKGTEDEPGNKQLADLLREEGGKGTGWLQAWIAQRAELGENEIMVYDKGVPTIYKVHNPLTYESMRYEPATQASFFIQTLSSVASLKRAGIILSPGFQGRNILRDLVNRTIISRRPGLLVNPLSKVPRTLFYDYYAKSDSYWAWKRAGGSMAHLVALDIDAMRRAEQLIEGPGTGPRARFDQAVGKVRTLTEYSEAVTRLSEFQLFAERGEWTHDAIMRAAYESRDLIDFLRMGRWMKRSQLARTVAFLNAGIQGLDRTARAVKERPGLTMMRAFLYAGLPSIVLGILQHDDEEYLKLSGPRRVLYWNLRTADDTFTKIPKPFDFTPLASTLEFLTVAAMNGDEQEMKTILSKAGIKLNKRDMQDFLAVWPMLVDNLIPFADPVGAAEALSRGNWKAAFAQTAGGITPDAIMTVAELFANYDSFRNRHIQSPYYKGLPGHDTSPGPPQWVKRVGKEMGISPRHIEHIIHSTTGNLGRLGSWGMEHLYDRMSGGKGDPKALRFHWFGFAGRTHPYYTTAFHQFAEVMTIAGEANVSYTDAAGKSYGDFSEIRRRNPDAQAIEGAFEPYLKWLHSKRVKEVVDVIEAKREQAKKLYENKHLTEDAKRQRIDRLNDAIYNQHRKALKYWYQIKQRARKRGWKEPSWLAEAFTP